MPSWIILLLPLVGVIVGWVLSIFTNNRTNRQQLERERIAYIRSLKDAKRERLRSAYKVILNLTREYEVEAQHQHDHMADPVNISISGVDEAVNEIKLEDVGSDVITIFYEIQGAFHAMYANLSMPDEGSWSEVIKQKKIVVEKVNELTASMQQRLKELES